MLPISAPVIIFMILLFVIIVLLAMIGNVLDKIHYVLKEIMHKLLGG